jgi:hypothetical protein
VTVTPRTTAPQFPDDVILDTLQASLAAITGADLNAVAASIEQGIAVLADTSLATPQPVRETLCDNPAPNVAPACRQRSLAVNTAEVTLHQAQVTAIAAMTVARDTWGLAVTTYDYAMSNARLAYTNAAIATSPVEIANALQTYEASAAAAATTLSAAAGNLLLAYSAFIGALSQAQAILAASEAIANHAFWQSVEALG